MACACEDRCLRPACLPHPGCLATLLVLLTRAAPPCAPPPLPQGEMVQAKFGVPSVALRQLEVFCNAVLTATLQVRCQWIGRGSGAAVPPAAGACRGGARSSSALLTGLHATPRCCAVLQPPKPPQDVSWRDLMEEMSGVSCKGAGGGRVGRGGAGQGRAGGPYHRLVPMRARTVAVRASR